MRATTWTFIRIQHLKGIQEKWSAQLGQLEPSCAQHFHLAEALEDLQTLIRHLEDDAAPMPADDRRGDAAVAIRSAVSYQLPESRELTSEKREALHVSSGGMRD